MEITVNRLRSHIDATIGEVLVDGVKVCDCIEDEYRNIKVIHETRIPAGEYKVGLRKLGGFQFRYSKRFPDFHKGMLHVLDVPGFEYILIHCGNTDDDTSGCLIVGEAVPDDWMVRNSAKTYEKFYKMVIDSAINGTLTIKYVDKDR